MPGKVEAIGISRALASVQAADLVLLLEDVTSPGVLPAATTDAPVLKVASKIDLMGDAHRLTHGRHDIEVSAVSGAGVNELLTLIRAGRRGDRYAGGIVPARARHVGLLREAARSLATAVGIREPGLELRAKNCGGPPKCSAELPGRSMPRKCGAIFSSSASASDLRETNAPAMRGYST